MLEFNKEHLKEPAEIALEKALEKTSREVASSLKTHAYEQAFEQLAGLQPPLADLFDNVKILDDNPVLRQNRLALLQKVFSEFSLLVDFSKIR